MAADADDIRAPHLRRDDFLGVFAVIEDQRGVLMVRNRRHIAGSWTSTWDLPGGQVERGERLPEALARELHEELGILLRRTPRFLFYQEGERVNAGARRYVWRSFFFAVDAFDGTPRADNEIEALEWFGRDRLPAVLTAPYHDSFAIWLASGGTSFSSTWED